MSSGDKSDEAFLSYWRDASDGLDSSDKPMCEMMKAWALDAFRAGQRSSPSHVATTADVQKALEARQDATDAATKLIEDGFHEAADTILNALHLLDSTVIRLERDLTNVTEQRDRAAKAFALEFAPVSVSATVTTERERKLVDFLLGIADGCNSVNSIFPEANASMKKMGDDIYKFVAELSPKTSAPYRRWHQ